MSLTRPPVLIAARFPQGIGAALQASVILAIIVIEFPSPAERARAMSAYVFTAVARGSLGLLAGGALTQLLNWHWIFLVDLPIGLFALLAGRALIPHDDGLGLHHDVDWAGSLLVTLAIGIAVYAIVEATSHGWGSTQSASRCSNHTGALLASHHGLEPSLLGGHRLAYARDRQRVGWRPGRGGAAALTQRHRRGSGRAALRSGRRPRGRRCAARHPTPVAG